MHKKKPFKWEVYFKREKKWKRKTEFLCLIFINKNAPALLIKMPNWISEIMTSKSNSGFACEGSGLC